MTSRRKRVLLAEDDEGVRRAMSAVLRSMGYDVVETVDGGRMLVAIAAQYKHGRVPQEIDLVVTDVSMPVVSGLEVFKALRVAHWKTPVIVVTGLDTREVHETVARYGAVLLSKPLELEEFERVVHHLLEDEAPSHAVV